MSGFINLHVHSDGSVLDGMSTVDKLIEFAKLHDCPAVSITDHGTMHNAFELYEKAIKNDLKPIIGCEVYLVEKSDVLPKPKKETRYHLVLLAKNTVGYYNLMKIVSLSHEVENFHYKPRTDLATIKKYKEGLIALSACIQGEIPRTILDGRTPLPVIQKYKKIFGDDFYLEVMNTGVEEQQIVNNKLFEYAEKTGTKVVLTSDAHYLYPEDAEAHDILLAIQSKSTVGNPNRFSFLKNNITAHMITDRMIDQFIQQDERYKDAVENVKYLVDTIEIIEIKKKNTLPIPNTGNKTVKDALAYNTKKGVVGRFGGKAGAVPQEYKDRVSYELSVINDLHFNEYFLTVWDYVNWAKNNGIIIGPGRGSAVGSVVSWGLGLTEVNPIQYNLFFERFLNQGRAGSYPDIDLDFPSEGREKIVTYLKNTYGSNNVLPICNLMRLHGRSAIRDVARALGFQTWVGDKLAKSMPETIRGHAAKVADWESSIETKAIIDENPEYKKILDIASKLEGVIRSVSVHASGVIISRDSIDNHSPIGLVGGVEGTKVSQYDMKSAEKVGLVKFDLLSLNTISVIEESINTIRSVYGKKITLKDIPLDDKKVFNSLCCGDTLGVFQVESSGMTNLCSKLEPQSIGDLAALLALYRPGPLDNELDKHLLHNKTNEKENWKLMEIPQRIQHVLDNSYGVLLYQEQIMEIVKTMAGASLVEADNFRKAVGKKDKEKMESLKDGFVNGCIKNGFLKKEAEVAFEVLEKYSDYSFNLSHATAYAVITYLTAYLKTHFPDAFLAALCSVKGIDILPDLVRKRDEHGVKIIAPDVNQSFYNTTITTNNEILLGFHLIKGGNKSLLQKIPSERERNGQYKSLSDLIERTSASSLQTNQFIVLAQVGALRSLQDKLGYTRTDMTNLIPTISNTIRKTAKKILPGQIGLFSGVNELQSFDPKVSIRIEDDVVEMYKNEVKYFGIPLVVDHPLIHLDKQLGDDSNYTKLHNIKDKKLGETVRTYGLVNSISTRLTKKTKKPIAFLTLEDKYLGQYRIIVFPQLYEKLGVTYINSLLNKTIVICGKIQENQDKTEREIIADSLREMD